MERALTPRERNLVLLASHGHTDDNIAHSWGMSRWTIREHWKRIFPALGADNRAHAVAIALRNEVIR
jgi:two-component system, NarL family, response regulator